MTDSERDELAELRIFALAAPSVLKLLERRQKVTLERLRSAFKSGENHLTIVAEYATLADLESDVKNKQLTYQILEEKYANQTRK